MKFWALLCDFIYDCSTWVRWQVNYSRNVGFFFEILFMLVLDGA